MVLIFIWMFSEQSHIKLIFSLLFDCYFCRGQPFQATSRRPETYATRFLPLCQSGRHGADHQDFTAVGARHLPVYVNRQITSFIDCQEILDNLMIKYILYSGVAILRPKSQESDSTFELTQISTQGDSNGQSPPNLWVNICSPESRGSDFTPVLAKIPIRGLKI